MLNTIVLIITISNGSKISKRVKFVFKWMLKSESLLNIKKSLRIRKDTYNFSFNMSNSSNKLKFHLNFSFRIIINYYPNLLKKLQRLSIIKLIFINFK